MSRKLQKSNEYSFVFNNLIDICTQKKITVTSLIEKYQSSSALQAWKNGKINAEIIPNLASDLGVSIEYLLTGKEKYPSIQDDELELLKYYKELPKHGRLKLIGRAAGMAEVYKEQLKAENFRPQIAMTTINIAEVAAGAGVSTPFTIDNAFSPRDFPADAVPVEADCGVPINGDSMEPQYPNGCIAWVKCTDTANPGDVIIAVLNGEPYCKIYQPDGLHSYNKDYETIRINEQDNFYIFGKVVGNFTE